MLTDLGHDVLSGLETDPRATDEALLALANQEQRVLITEDKDFGELVFVRRFTASVYHSLRRHAGCAPCVS